MSEKSNACHWQLFETGSLRWLCFAVTQTLDISFGYYGNIKQGILITQVI
jgi:hypothetical protein